MRYFPTLSVAALEIRRDLSKSPTLKSSRVQNKLEDHVVQEAMNYAYTIRRNGVPDLIHLRQIMLESFPLMYSVADHIVSWVEQQTIERTEYSDRVSDFSHPWLSTMTEGNHYGYTYGERLRDSVNQIVRLLDHSPDTRRGYWPIFHPLDSTRSPYPTRIPCSLGYQVLIRNVPGQGDFLDMTYLQRSCDFERFWLTDVFLAVQWQKTVLSYLEDSTVQLGNFTHFIVSLHRFTDTNEEIY